MRIEIPQSSWPVTRVICHLPDGKKITGEFLNTHKVWDVDLPEGVNENAVSIDAEFLSNGHKVEHGQVIKFSIDVPAGPGPDDPGPPGDPGVPGDLGEGPVNLTAPIGDADPEAKTDLDCGCKADEACDECDPPKPAEDKPAAPPAE